MDTQSTPEIFFKFDIKIKINMRIIFQLRHIVTGVIFKRIANLIDFEFLYYF